MKTGVVKTEEKTQERTEGRPGGRPGGRSEEKPGAKSEEHLRQAPPLTPDAYRHAISRLPTGITVVTAQRPDGPVGCTVNAVMSLSLAPPSLVVSLATV